MSNPYQPPNPAIATPKAPIGPSKPFNVMVKSEPSKFAKGQFRCEVLPNGLMLKKGKKQELFLPVGGGAEYLGKNRIATAVQGVRVEVSMTRWGSYQNRLARDTAQFLRGEGPMPQVADYGLPWGLLILAVLPIGIPIMTLGGALPAVIGIGLAGANFAIVQNEEMSLVARVALCVAITIGAYVAFGFLMVLAFAAQRGG